jgi:hypothetical protein
MTLRFIFGRGAARPLNLRRRVQRRYRSGFSADDEEELLLPPPREGDAQASSSGPAR